MRERVRRKLIMGKLFGTDGIRGIANEFLDAKLAYKTGRMAAHVLREEGKNVILIGKDTRKSGDLLEAALVAGITSAGVNTLRLEVIPTPGIAYLTRKLDAMAGIVISASHNPGEYNGLKIFSHDGFKLPDETEDRIEELILAEEDTLPHPIGAEVGTSIPEEHHRKDYIDYLVGECEYDLTGLTIALDCAHGATYEIAPEVFERLGAKVVAINREPDGMNINRGCGSTNPEIIEKLVLESGADVGFAFDGDGDRVMAVDEKGKLMDGDHILAATSLFLRKRGALNHDTIVGTVMSNLGLLKFCEKEGLKFISAAVGDRYVLEEMRKNGYVLGGEQSGHIIFFDKSTTGDGILTAIEVLNAMREKNMPLSELAGYMKSYPQVLVNAFVEEKKKKSYLDDEVIRDAIEKLEETFDGQGRVLIRPSGTEPLVRVMIEGKDEGEIEREAKKLAQLIEERLGGNHA